MITLYRKKHVRMEYNVSRLWDGGKIVAFAFSTPQLIRDMKRLELKGRIEEKVMPMYLIDMMAKEVHKK